MKPVARTLPVPDRRPSPLRQSVKWLHLESIESFTPRLLAANTLDTQMLRLATAPKVHEHRYRVDEHAVLIEGLAGRPAGHYDRLRRLAQPDPELTYPERFLCRYCARGETVQQIPHDRENWCLRHPGQLVWVGPGTTPESQFVLPYNHVLARAERRFRRLVTAGRVTARLHARVWEMVRDNAWLTRPEGWTPALAAFPDDHEVRGRASLYPETITILELLSDPTVIGGWRMQHPDELRGTITQALSISGPLDVLVERIVLWLRPLRREILPTRVDPLNVPLDLVDAGNIIDTTAPYPVWIQRHPRAVTEWDWSRNDASRDPWDARRASEKAWWVCNGGHAWKIEPSVRGRAESSCPYCVNQAVWPGDTDLGTTHPELADQWDKTPGANVGDPDHVGAGSSRRITWVCPAGHRWAASIAGRSRGSSGCPYCSGRLAIPGETDLATLRPDLAVEWDTERNGETSPSSVSLRSGKAAWWRGSCGHRWRTTIVTRSGRDGCGCPYCANRAVLPGFNDLATTHPELVAEWDASNSKSPREVTAGSGYRATWECALGHVWQSVVGTRARRGAGCPYCANSQVLAGFNDLATTHRKLAAEWDTVSGANDRTPSEVTRRSGYRAGWKCHQGHAWKAPVSQRGAGTGCPYCAGQRAIPGETDLATLRPDLAAEWDTSNDLNPDQVTAFSSRRSPGTAQTGTRGTRRSPTGQREPRARAAPGHADRIRRQQREPSRVDDEPRDVRWG